MTVSYKSGKKIWQHFYVLFQTSNLFLNRLIQNLYILNKLISVVVYFVTINKSVDVPQDKVSPLFSDLYQPPESL